MTDKYTHCMNCNPGHSHPHHQHDPHRHIDNGKGFMEDCPGGRMDREKMRVMFAAIMPKVVITMVMVMVVLMVVTIHDY